MSSECSSGQAMDNPNCSSGQELKAPASREGSYACSARTQRQFRDAFVKLSTLGKPVTVTNLCKVTGRNRSTFYAHYTCMDDLEKQVIQHLITQVTALVRETVTKDFWEDPKPVIEAVGAFIEQDHEVLRYVYRHQSSEFDHALRQSMLSVMGDVDMQRHMAFDLVASGLIALYLSWINGRYGDVDITVVNQVVERIITREA